MATNVRTKTRVALYAIPVALCALVLSACGSLRDPHPGPSPCGAGVTSCGAPIGSPTLEHFAGCLASTPELTVDVIDPGDELVTFEQQGAPRRRGKIIQQAPVYTTYVYLFPTQAAAARAARTEQHGPEGTAFDARYVIGPALVAGHVAFSAPISGQLPQSVLGAVGGCLRESGATGPTKPATTTVYVAR